MKVSDAKGSVGVSREERLEAENGRLKERVAKLEDALRCATETAVGEADSRNRIHLDLLVPKWLFGAMKDEARRQDASEFKVAVRAIKEYVGSKRAFEGIDPDTFVQLLFEAGRCCAFQNRHDLSEVCERAAKAFQFKAEYAAST